MIWIDYGIIGLISFFAFIGLIRGFATEAVSLLALGLAAWIGLSFSQALSLYFRSMIAPVAPRLAAAFLILVLLTLIVGRLLRGILRQLVASSGLSGSSRFAGLLVGTGRGLLLVAIFVMLAGLTHLPRDPWWRESGLIRPFQEVALWVKEKIPSGVAGNISYRH